MLKKRLIFVLFFMEGNFYLSRNFVLQKVGDTNWLIDKFKFSCIGDYIDELIIYDVTRDRNSARDLILLEESLKKLMSQLFLPLTIGGGIKTIEQAASCFKIGADKIALNTTLVSEVDFVKECVRRYGSQAVLASVDTKRSSEGYVSFIRNGEREHLSLTDHISAIVQLNVGEICINSIDQDGTGTGLDLDLLEVIPKIPMPLIISGGAGKPEHFAAALRIDSVSAVATGNLFNFIGSGFSDARVYLSSHLSNVRQL